MAVAPKTPQPPHPAGVGDGHAAQRATLLLEWLPAILHRLNNLTGVVLGMSDLLASAEADAQKRERLTVIRDQAQSMADILRMLGNTTFVRDEPRGLHDLRELVRELVEFCDTIAKSRLQIELAEPRGLTVVHARPDELRWLLAALFQVGAPVLVGAWSAGDVELLRARIHGTPERVALFLCAEARPSSSRTTDLDPAALERCARELGCRLRTRVSRQAWFARLVLPGAATRD
jgi:hypothetical protein